MSLTWNARFPAFSTIGDPAFLDAAERACVKSIPPQTTIYRPGDPCRHFLLVTRGRVHVGLPSTGDKSIEIYAVEAGEPCILTVANLLTGRSYQVIATSAAEVEAVVMKRADFERAMINSPGFRAACFAALGDVLDRLLGQIDRLAFHSLEERLAGYLLECEDEPGIMITHEELARALNTERAAISRTLKAFERAGWAELGRRMVRLLDRDALRERAAGREQLNA